jgi:hypothetical protein
MVASHQCQPESLGKPAQGVAIDVTLWQQGSCEFYAESYSPSGGEYAKFMREVLYKHFVFGRIGGVACPPGFCGVCT